MNPPIVDPKQLSFAQLFELPEFATEKEAFFSDLRARAKTDTAFKKAVGGLKFDWNFNARPKQRIPDGDWYIWLIRSGRGFGKTRTGAEWIRAKEAEARKNRTAKTLEMAICNKTWQDDLVDVNVKAVLDVYPANDPNRPEFTNGKLVWKSGAQCYLVAAHTPEKFRGKNLTYIWIDELAKFLYPQKVWQELRFAVRKNDIQILITTTPSAKAKDILSDIERQKFGKAIVTYGSSYENTANSEAWRNDVLGTYLGTKLGDQEIYGKDVDYASGALWNDKYIKYWQEFAETKEKEAEAAGKALPKNWSLEYLKNFKAVVIGVDPAVTAHAKSDETGIVVCARDHQGNGFVLEDLSGRYTPDQWSRIAVGLYNKYKAKCIVVEKNNGGDLLKATIYHTDPKVNVELIHSAQGKIDRAMPVARLYEQGRVYHLDIFNLLEYQMCNYTSVRPTEKDYDIETTQPLSPDRMDALTHAMRYLFSDLLKIPSRGKTSFRVSAY